MLVLFETPAGYALFKVADKLTAVPTDALGKEFATAEDAHSAVKLAAFHRFADTTEVRFCVARAGNGAGGCCVRCCARAGAPARAACARAVARARSPQLARGRSWRVAGRLAVPRGRRQRWRSAALLCLRMKNESRAVLCVRASP
jgi:hypothetical protein